MPNDANEVIRSIHRAEQKRLYGDMAVVGEETIREPVEKEPIPYMVLGPGGDFVEVHYYVEHDIDSQHIGPPMWLVVFLLFGLVSLVAALAWLWGRVA